MFQGFITPSISERQSFTSDEQKFCEIKINALLLLTNEHLKIKHIIPKYLGYEMRLLLTHSVKMILH